MLLDAAGQPISRSAHADNAGGAIDPRLAQFLMAALAPAFKAVEQRIQQPARPKVMVLPRTTEYMADSERSRRVVQYGRGKPADLLSHELLRTISSSSLLNVAIHSTRRQQVRSVCRRHDGRRNRPGWQIVHRRHFDPRFDVSQVANLEARCDAIAQIIDSPHPLYDTNLGAVLVKCTEDHLALDRVCVNMIRGILDATGTQGPVQFAHVDGSTIWPMELYLDHFVRLNNIVRSNGEADFDEGLRQFYEQTGQDLRDCRYLQVDPERSLAPLTYLTDDDLLIAVANPSPQMRHWGYGKSPAEESYMATSLYLHGMGYVASFFRDAMSDTVALLNGTEYDDADVQLVTEILKTHHSGAGKQFNTPLITLGNVEDLKFVPTRTQSAQDMQFAETIHHATMLGCAPYSIDPSEINLDPKGPGGGTALTERNRDGERQEKLDRGLLNLLSFLADHVLTPMVRRHDPDLMFAWLGIDDRDEEQEITLLSKETDYWLSLNEARQQRGLPLFQEEWAAYPKWRAQAIAQQGDQQKMMEAQQAAQAQQGGQPGQPPGGPGDAQEGPPEGQPDHLQWDDGMNRGGPEAGKAPSTQAIHAGGFLVFETDSPPTGG